MTTKVKHPILRLEVVAADGTRGAEHRVFCRNRRESVRVEHCCECVLCDEITSGPSPSVNCSLPDRPPNHADDPAGESIDVGALLRNGSVALHQSSTVGRALGLLREEDRRSVGVVDNDNVLVGLVHEAGFVGRLGPPRTGIVGASMSSAIAVNERTPVRVALKLLAANHLREATVVTRDGIPLGVFRDVDGLRWIAGSRGSPDDD